MHALDPPAEHGLNGIGRERVFQRNDKIDVLQVLLQPALNTLIQIAHVLEHDGAFLLDVESQDRVRAKLLHGTAEPAAGFGWEHIAMKGFTRERAGNGSVRTDQPEIEAELLGDGQSKFVPPPGYQDDFDALLMGAAQRCKVYFRDLKLWIEQGAVDIGSQQTDRRSHHRRVYHSRAEYRRTASAIGSPMNTMCTTKSLALDAQV